jgi:hypothetical protein
VASGLASGLQCKGHHDTRPRSSTDAENGPFGPCRLGHRPHPKVETYPRVTGRGSDRGERARSTSTPLRHKPKSGLGGRGGVVGCGDAWPPRPLTFATIAAAPTSRTARRAARLPLTRCPHASRVEDRRKSSWPAWPILATGDQLDRKSCGGSRSRATERPGETEPRGRGPWD